MTIDMAEFMEMQAFSVPKDGLLTGISGGGMVFSGEMGADIYYLHAALYECSIECASVKKEDGHKPIFFSYAKKRRIGLPANGKA